MLSANVHIKSTRHEMFEKRQEYWMELFYCCPFPGINYKFGWILTLCKGTQRIFLRCPNCALLV